MARMKDIWIELQNIYGLNLEEAPEGFSVEDYLKEKVEKEEEEEKATK